VSLLDPMLAAPSVDARPSELDFATMKVNLFFVVGIIFQ
jgi:hypothetical protein